MKKLIDNMKTWYFEERYSFFDFTIITILGELLEKAIEYFIFK